MGGGVRSVSDSIGVRLRRAGDLILLSSVSMGAVLMLAGTPASAEDWGMGAANREIARGAVFSPVSTPASEIATLAWFTLAITLAIFLTVGGLLLYSVIRFRARPSDEQREPPQLYGSDPIEFAWTAIPLLIVFVLALTTVRTIFDVQAAVEPPNAVHVAGDWPSMVVGISISRFGHSHCERAACSAERPGAPNANVARA